MAPVPLITADLGVSPVEEAVFLGVLPMDFGGCWSAFHPGVGCLVAN